MGAMTTSGDKRGYLLDTHTFLWASQDPQRLGTVARALIENTGNKLYLSSISAYEAANKYRLGKLVAYEFLLTNYTEVMRRLCATDLPVTLAHTYQAGCFEWEHRDPFDRILVAQAALENLVLITNDAHLKALPWCETVW